MTPPPSAPPGRPFQGISVYLPAGIYKVSATLTITQNGTALFGDGPESTVIMMSATPDGPSTTNLPVIATGIGSSGSLSYLSIRGMTVTRDTSNSLSHPAVAGGNGINAGFPGITDCLIADVFATNHFAGFALGSVAYGVVLNCQAALCQSHGFYFQNDISSQTPSNLQAAIQWMMINPFSQLNNGWGFYLQTVAPEGGSVPNLAVYPWFYPVTFGNLGGGCFIGGAAPPVGSTTSPCPVSTFHIVGGFFGQDNYHGIYINSYGEGHKICDCACIGAGTFYGGGVLMNAPASNQGYGLLSLNNSDITITGSNFAQNSWSGVAILGNSTNSTYTTEAVVTGCRIVNNNVKYTYSSSGVLLSIGPNSYFKGLDVGPQANVASCVVSGCRIGCQNYSPSVAFQNYAIGAQYGSNVSVIGNDLRHNYLGPFYVPAGMLFTGTVVVGGVTYNLNTNLV